LSTLRGTQRAYDDRNVTARAQGSNVRVFPPKRLTYRKSLLTVSNGLRRGAYRTGRPHPPPHTRGVARAAQDCGRVGGRPASEPARRVTGPEGARGGEAGAGRAATQSPGVSGAA